jgi:DNA-binding XRE family transcriptional regulator
MIMRGEMKPARITEIAEPETKEIREATKLTQGEFARLIGVPVKTLKNWEQHRPGLLDQLVLCYSSPSMAALMAAAVLLDAPSLIRMLLT